MRDLATQIYDALKEKIVSNKFLPHETLTEGAIAHQFNVSRSTAKKAIMMLNSDGLVTVEQYKSAQIAERSLDEVVSLLELRSVIEGYIVSNAAKAITDRQIALLQGQLNEMKEFIDHRQLREYVQCNVKFHDTISSACTNQTAIKMNTQLKNLMRKYSVKTILIPNRDTASYQEHVAIFNAIKARNAEGAAAAMQRHINNLKTTFQENLDLLL